MFGIGFLEICVIAGVALLVVGPKGLPQLTRQLGRLFVQVQRMTSDVRSSMDEVVREAETELRLEEARKINQSIEAIGRTKISDLTNPTNHTTPPSHHPHSAADDSQEPSMLPQTSLPVRPAFSSFETKASEEDPPPPPSPPSPK